MAIPMKSLMELQNRTKELPKEGDQWRINFTRVAWEHDVINGTYQRKKENGKLLKESYWVWSNQMVANMHQPEMWGVLQFTNEFVSKNVQYAEDINMHSKQVAYALFRQTRFGTLKNLLEHKVGHTQKLNVTFSEKKELQATFHKN